MGAAGAVGQRRARPVPLVASGVALLGWLVGTPLLLLVWGGWPVSGAPGWAQFRDLPLPAVVDQVIIGTLSVALWGIWGQFAYGVGVEVVALVRHREPSRRTDDAIRRFARHVVEAAGGRFSPDALDGRHADQVERPARTGDGAGHGDRDGAGHGDRDGAEHDGHEGHRDEDGQLAPSADDRSGKGGRERHHDGDGKLARAPSEGDGAGPDGPDGRQGRQGHNDHDRQPAPSAGTVRR